MSDFVQGLIVGAFVALVATVLAGQAFDTPSKLTISYAEKQPHQRIHMLSGVNTTGTKLTKLQGLEIWCVDGYKYAYFDGDKSGGAVQMFVPGGEFPAQPAACKE